jgi:hypothetical protein
MRVRAKWEQGTRLESGQAEVQDAMCVVCPPLVWMLLQFQHGMH